MFGLIITCLIVIAVWLGIISALIINYEIRIGKLERNLLEFTYRDYK